MVLAKAVTVEHCQQCGTPVKDIPIYTTRQVLRLKPELQLMRLTQWVQPGESIVCHYVWPHIKDEKVMAGDWLKAQAARVLRDPNRRAALVVRINTGEQAIYVNRVAGSPHDTYDDEDEEPED